MIETLIKRDGSTEPYQAAKVNGWGEWSAKALGDLVDWPTAVMHTVGSLPAVSSTKDLQHSLIRYCLGQNTWSWNRMAGKLYATTHHKDLYPKGKRPTIQEVQARLVAVGYMVPLAYSDAEYALLETVIDHHRDFEYAHSQIHQIRYKYALRNAVTQEEYESCQFVFMRMAMALGEDQPKERRMDDVIAWYDMFSRNKINCPTPNYTNLGTKLNGYASCCLIKSDDTADSLAIGDHIAYKMTVMSAGIGINVDTRSILDPVRGGLFPHRGKLWYYRALQGAVQANIKNGRNGACNIFFSAYDPENRSILRLKNPMTPSDMQIRGMDYAMMTNKFLGRKAARKEDVFLFNSWTAPDLTAAFYGPSLEKFIEIYEKYEADPSFKKIYMSAREILLHSRNEAYETGRAYFADMGEINRHTTYKDPIHSSNLCMEITEPTEAYEDMRDLYTNGPVGHVQLLDHHRETRRYDAAAPIKFKDGHWDAAQNLKVGDEYYVEEDGKDRLIKVSKIKSIKRESEVALCSLAGIVLPNIDNEAEYERAMYYALLMIDKCIHKSEYVLPHLGYTAKNRMSAGVGIMSLAHHLARKGLKYSTTEGLEEMHRVAERHMYYAIKASLKLGQELGNAPWIHRTKWTEGWLPLDTYNKNVDELVPNATLQYDWEALRSEIKANGGIRNSSLVAYMPGESSSKASGGFNSIYPARDLWLMKTDNGNSIYWTAPESDTLKDAYELAWDVPIIKQLQGYAVFQKWTDMAISADVFQRLQGSQKVTSDEMLQQVFTMYKYGVKTQYYTNTKTPKAVVLDRPELKGKLITEVTTITKRPVPIGEDQLTPIKQLDTPGTDDPVGGVIPWQDVVKEKTNLTDDFAYNNEGGAGCEGGACSL